MIDTNTTVDRSRNQYCGPLVLAAILGKTTAEASQQVRNHCDVSRVRGMYNWQLRKVLEANGFRMTEAPVAKETKVRRMFGRQYMLRQGPTLAQWLRERSPDDVNLPFIVNTGHHYVLVKGRKFVDTYTKGEWVFLRSAPHRRKRVREAFRITKAPERA